MPIFYCSGIYVTNRQYLALVLYFWRFGIMNLILDIGNSFAKLAVYNGDSLVLCNRVNKTDLLQQAKQLKVQFPLVKSAIIASVGGVAVSDLETLKTMFNLLELNALVKLPFKNLYETPSTLGVDRIALVSAAATQYPGKNVLVIDAGTCVTFDFINNEAVYLGGAISPGLQMRYKALNTFTEKLPLLNQSHPEGFIGTSTNTSIHVGVVLGMAHELEGVIRRYKEEYKHLTVILTGGDANFLSEQLKSSIFVNSNFLLEGLNFILKYNTNE
ncbi:MAG: type III pantothenate kinase [Flavobacteriaceae bacterium]